MSRLLAATRRFVVDEQAAEVTELAIVLGLIVAGALVIIVAIGPKVEQQYTTFNTNFVP